MRTHRFRNRLTVWFGTGLLALLAVGTGGCEAIALPFLLWGEEPTRTVEAEYPYLPGKRVCIVVRPEMETLFQYPHVRLDLSDHLKVALEAHVADISVAEPKRVTDFQKQRHNWEAIDPAVLGRRFEADRLIEVELTQYTTRDPESPYLYRGHIAAVVNVYNTDYPNSAPAYSTEVRVAHPDEGPAKWGAEEREVRASVMQAFADEVAGKFYDRKVKVR